MNVPTIAKSNITTSYQMEVEQPTLDGINTIMADTSHSITARYVLGNLIVRGQVEGIIHVDFYNLAGQFVAQKEATLNAGYAEIPVGGLSNGYYIARVKDAQGNHTNCKFIKK